MSSVPRALPGTKGVGKVNREELAVQKDLGDHLGGLRGGSGT